MLHFHLFSKRAAIGKYPSSYNSNGSEKLNHPVQRLLGRNLTRLIFYLENMGIENYPNTLPIYTIDKHIDITVKLP